MKISTPTTDDGPIWKALTEEAGARFDFWVRCPHCGFFQHMDFERIAWPGKDEEKSPDAETWPLTPVNTAARCGMTATVTGRSGEGSGVSARPALS